MQLSVYAFLCSGTLVGARIGVCGILLRFTCLKWPRVAQGFAYVEFASAKARGALKLHVDACAGAESGHRVGPRAYAGFLDELLSGHTPWCQSVLKAMPKRHWFHYVSVAGKLHPLESLFFYGLSLGVVVAPAHMQMLFYANCVAQLGIFLPFVQLPVAFTGHLAYVDIGWPSGVLSIGVIALVWGTGAWLRRVLICGCYLLHGGRMALGALSLFGQATGFTYRFHEDLPRYRYAKYKWVKLDGMPKSTWWLKMQQEAFGQGFSNAVLLCVPAFLAACNTSVSLQPMEWLGLATWLLGWLLESAADVQKMLFLAECKGLPGTEDATLGVAPFDKQPVLH